MSMRNGLRDRGLLFLLCGSLAALGCGGDGDGSSETDNSATGAESTSGSGATEGDSGAPAGTSSSAGDDTTDAAPSGVDSAGPSGTAGVADSGAGADSGGMTDGTGVAGMESGGAMDGPGMDDPAMDEPPVDNTPPSQATMDMTEALFGTSEDRNRVQAGDVCERISTIECAGEQRCCTEPGRDFEECVETMVEGCRITLQLDYMTAKPVTGFDAVRAETAIARFEQMAKECDPLVATIGEDPEGLRGMMQGSLAPDDSCFPPVSPANIFGAYNEAATYMAACSDPAKYACLPDSPFDWRCTERGGVGAFCFTDLNCQEGLYCPQEDPTMPQLGIECAEALPTGAECSFSNECTSLACVRGACAEAGDIQATFCLKGE